MNKVEEIKVRKNKIRDINCVVFYKKKTTYNGLSEKRMTKS